MEFLKALEQAKELGVSKEEFITVWEAEARMSLKKEEARLMELRRAGTPQNILPDTIPQVDMNGMLGPRTETLLQEHLSQMHWQKEELKQHLDQKCQLLHNHLAESQEQQVQQTLQNHNSAMEELRQHFQILFSHVTNTVESQLSTLKLFFMQEMELMKQDLIGRLHAMAEEKSVEHALTGPSVSRTTEMCSSDETGQHNAIFSNEGSNVQPSQAQAKLTIQQFQQVQLKHQQQLQKEQHCKLLQQQLQQQLQLPPQQLQETKQQQPKQPQQQQKQQNLQTPQQPKQQHQNPLQQQNLQQQRNPQGQQQQTQQQQQQQQQKQQQKQQQQTQQQQKQQPQQQQTVQQVAANSQTGNMEKEITQNASYYDPSTSYAAIAASKAGCAIGANAKSALSIHANVQSKIGTHPGQIVSGDHSSHSSVVGTGFYAEVISSQMKHRSSSPTSSVGSRSSVSSKGTTKSQRKKKQQTRSNSSIGRASSSSATSSSGATIRYLPVLEARFTIDHCDDFCATHTELNTQFYYTVSNACKARLRLFFNEKDQLNVHLLVSNGSIDDSRRWPILFSGKGRIYNKTSDTLTNMWEFSPARCNKPEPGAEMLLRAKVCLSTARGSHLDITYDKLVLKGYAADNCFQFVWNMQVEETLSP